MEIIQRAIDEGRAALSEYESKLVLKDFGIPVTNEVLVKSGTDLDKACASIGFPLVIKACSPNISHKTERGLIHTDVRSREDAIKAYEEILSRLHEGESADILVQEMAHGKRELVAGMNRDSQFGPCVMFGLGGIFTEVLNDVSFRVAPIDLSEAMEMMSEIRGAKILENIRGMEEADREALAKILVTIGAIGIEQESVKEIDINPIILSGSRPLAVDALIVLQPS